MAFADSAGVRLSYWSRGRGAPVVFVHEFAGDARSWAPQVRALSRAYRCITFNARGYPPSDVPDRERDYSQALAADDIAAVVRAAGAVPAHVVGLSMGGYAALHFGLRFPELARSLVVAGCGYGSMPSQRRRFRADAEATARRFERVGMARAGPEYARGRYRLRLKDKDPRAWRAFAAGLAEHSARGSALTARGVMARRPSVFSLRARLARLPVPTLVVTGDEDEPCVEPSLFLKRTIPGAALLVLPRTAHTLNLEEPRAFNDALRTFFAAVDRREWRPASALR